MDDQRAAAESIQGRRADERFAEQLRTLRTSVGNPSFRKMAGRSGRISHTTLHEAAAGTRFPSWETTREFVRACEADEVQWRRRWEDAQRPETVHTVPDGDPTPVNTDSPAGVGTPSTVETMTTGTVAAERSLAVDTPAAGRPAASGVAASSDLVPESQRALPAGEPPQAAAKDGVRRTRRHRSPGLAAVAVVAVAAMVAVLFATARGWSSPDGSGAVAAVAVAVVAMVAVLSVTARSRLSPDDSGAAAASSPPGFSDALIPGDSIQFVADITIPDGTRVKVNEHFVKVWALANAGSVVWHNRFLARMDPTGDDDGCQLPDRVAVGDTPPGEQVMISVPVVAPNRPGTWWVGWKMVDEHGQAFFPSRRPVYFLVTVVA